MQSRKRKLARFSLAVGSGVVALLAISLAWTLFTLGYAGHNLPLQFWGSYLLRMLLITLPIYVVGCSVAVLVYALLLRPKHDNECRCRRCGYILRGLSRLECPECGEAI